MRLDLLELLATTSPATAAPFLYLLIGDERALLLDTGATADPQLFPLRATIDELLAQRTGEPAYPLVVAHTHGHGDTVLPGRLYAFDYSVRRG